MPATDAEPERLDPTSDRARRIADNLAEVFADVELAIEQRRRAHERDTSAA